MEMEIENEPKVEDSIYKNGRIRLSQMDLLELIHPNDIEKIKSRSSKPLMPSISESLTKRKNAQSKVILSQDSLNEYHLKRNLVIW